MEIEKLQSINIEVFRETSSTCFIELYAEWSITNYTMEDLSLVFKNTKFIIDKASLSCLSDVNSKNVSLSIVG